MNEEDWKPNNLFTLGAKGFWVDNVKKTLNHYGYDKQEVFMLTYLHKGYKLVEDKNLFGEKK